MGAQFFGSRGAEPKHRAPTSLLAAAFLSLGVLAISQTPLVGAAKAQDASLVKVPLSFADLVAKVRPAVVGINVTTNPNKEFFDEFKKNNPEQQIHTEQEKPSRSQGSGFVISPDGYVVTTHTVITDKAEEIEVVFNDDGKYSAKLVGSDARTDLAVLKITSPKTDFPYLEFAKKQPRIGGSIRLTYHDGRVI